MFMQPLIPDPILEELLKQARNYKMTPEERRLQRISFALGQLMKNPEITREMVEDADKELYPEDYS